MDYAHVLSLIAALNGDPGPPASGHIVDAAKTVTIGHCIQPMPADEIEGQTLICGTVRVPENHSLPDGRQIDLQFAVLKAQTSYPEPDPLVHLHGGPGTGIVGDIPLYAETFAAWRRNRDVVLFDQRAAGLSGTSVNCYNMLSHNALQVTGTEEGGDDDPSGGYGACFDELRAKGVDLTAYNTTQNALDVRDVVTALGYKDYNIYGISYGTELALEVMRSVPEGLRAVIIDGVAPPNVRSYDNNAVPLDQAITALVQQCAADAACNAAYPELGVVINDLLDKANAGTLMLNGSPIDLDTVLAPFTNRNGAFGSPSMTPYIPAYMYELQRGGNAPTVGMLSRVGYVLDDDVTADAVTQAAASLSTEQQGLVADLLRDIDISGRVTEGIGEAINTLITANPADSTLGPVVQLFDTELSKAMDGMLASGTLHRDTVVQMIVDYSALQNAKPDKAPLADFITRFFTGDEAARLTALLDAMSPTELAGTFALVRQSTYSTEEGFLGGGYLVLYACQEDFPYNTDTGFDEAAKTLNYPGIAPSQKESNTELVELCKATLKPQPRAGYHDAVVSDIPILAIGSLWDTQTAQGDAAFVVGPMANGQSVLIPEAGHGAVLYQACVKDMGASFIDHPMRRISTSCPDSIKFNFYIAPWVVGQTGT